MNCHDFQACLQFVTKERETVKCLNFSTHTSPISLKIGYYLGYILGFKFFV